jgi:hypothetical protein
LFINQKVNVDKVWARVLSDYGCARVSEIELVVSTTRIPSDFYREFEVCDDFIDEVNIDLEEIDIVDDSNNNTIYIQNKNNNLGVGNYEFFLNDRDFGFQNEAFFESVYPAVHTVFIRDKKGCGLTEIVVSVIGYPKFFIPNNDGQNDT